MPYSDPEKQREANRKAQQRRRDRLRNPGPGRPPKSGPKRLTATTKPAKPAAPHKPPPQPPDPPDASPSVRAGRAWLWKIGTCKPPEEAGAEQVNALGKYIATEQQAARPEASDAFSFIGEVNDAVRAPVSDEEADADRPAG